MNVNYNQFAGRNLERLATLSDGIFAIAMTLLVLDLRVPVSEAFHSQQPLWINGAIQSEQVLWDALVKLAPNLLAYFMSFMTLGIFWIAQQTQISQFARSNRTLTWIHLAFLLAVSLMPFSTGLLAEFITYRLALLFYWLNLLFLGVMLFISWRYAMRAELMKDEVTDEIRAATERRIIIYQAVYAFGALLCIINTYVSIAFLILMQLNSVFAPRLRGLNRF
ncbi:MAG: TMEM175 family protein [Chloroflexota bacterium]